MVGRFWGLDFLVRARLNGIAKVRGSGEIKGKIGGCKKPPILYFISAIS